MRQKEEEKAKNREQELNEEMTVQTTEWREGLSLEQLAISISRINNDKQQNGITVFIIMFSNLDFNNADRLRLFVYKT